MKSGHTFKLSKEYKRQLSVILDPHKRGEIKRMFIQAQLGAEKAKNTRYSTKEVEE